MSSSKGGKGSESYDYFGSLFAAICHGPVDVLYSVLADGKAIYDNPSGLARSGNVTDLTGSIDAKYFTQGGYLKILWGTAAQTADAAESAYGHPDNKNIARLVAKNVLFGTEKTTAPNLEVICARKPVCDTSLCAALDNILDDGQVNPVAVLAEMFTSQHGLGWDVARLDAASWAAAGVYCHTNKASCFCSPLFTDHGDFRAAAASLLQMFDGALAWTTDGTLALKLLKWGNDPGGLTTLDATRFTAKPALKLGGWGDVPTGVVLRYFDRDRKFKQADEKLDNLVALHVRGEDDRRTLEFPHVTRRSQVVKLCAQAIRRLMNPPSAAELVIRRGHADFFPGDKLKLDVDPEPGGAGLAHLGVVTERRAGGFGPVKLSFKFDPIAESVPYTPTFIAENPQDADVASIPYALVLPVPGPAFAVLAARPAEDVVGFRVLFAVDNSDADKFSDLGTQPGFAVRCSLDANVAAGDDVLRLSLLDGAGGPDAYLAERTAGTPEEAANDILLAVIADVDGGTGRVTMDTDGFPKLEFASVVSRAAVDSDTHDYTVLRGRRSLVSRAWTAGGTTKVWLIPGTSLSNWSHDYLLSLLHSGDPGYVRLAAFTAYAEDESDPLPEFSFNLPEVYLVPPQIAWTTPADTPFDLDPDGEITPDAAITDADGNLVRIELFSVSDTGIFTSYLDVPFARTRATTLQDCFTLAGVSGVLNFTQASGDSYVVLTLRATDDAGNVTDSPRTLILPGGDTSNNLSSVLLTPPSGFVPYGSMLTFDLVAGSAATELHIGVVAIAGGAAPGGYLVFAAAALPFSAYGAAGSSGVSYRIWARSSDGVNHSPWEAHDYHS